MVKNKKTIRSLMAGVMAIMMIGCVACKNKESSTTPSTTTSSTTPSTSPSTPQPWEIAERAIRNFGDKLAAGNYVMHGPMYDLNVYSEDLVYLEFDEQYWINDGEDLFDVFSIMTINENETFYGFLKQGETGLDSVKDVGFINEGKAINAVSDGSEIYNRTYIYPRLINYWFDSGLIPYDNPFGETFYNLDALKFSASDQTVKDTISIIAFGGVYLNQVQRMEDVIIELDNENPTTAHITTSFSDGYPTLDPIDIEIEFGAATSESRAEAWMNATERVLPEAQTDWGDQVINLNALFLQGYGETAVPFPTFATYALVIDISRVVSNDEIIIRDCHASEESMQTYINTLLADGFVKDENSGDYHKLLRPDYKAYSSVSLAYNNGITMVIRPYYEIEEFASLSAVNTRLGTVGMPTLDNLPTGLEFISAYDNSKEYAESWLCLFDYDAVIYLNVRYGNNKEAFEYYLSDYIDKLYDEDYYETSSSDPEYDENGEEVDLFLSNGGDAPLREVAGDNTSWHKDDRSGNKVFRYHNNGDGTFTFLFKSEKYISNEIIAEQLAAQSFPALDEDLLDECCLSAKDLRLFNQYLRGASYPLSLRFTLVFDSLDQACDFIYDYTDTLDNQGYIMAIDPGAIAMADSTNAFYKAVDGTLWIVGYTINGNMVRMDYRVDPIPVTITTTDEEATGDFIKPWIEDAARVGKAFVIEFKSSTLAFSPEAADNLNNNAAIIYLMFNVSNDVEELGIDGATKEIHLEFSCYDKYYDDVDNAYTAGTISIETKLDVPSGKVAKVYYLNNGVLGQDMNATYANGRISFNADPNHYTDFVIVLENN